MPPKKKTSSRKKKVRFSKELAEVFHPPHRLWDVLSKHVIASSEVTIRLFRKLAGSKNVTRSTYTVATTPNFHVHPDGVRDDLLEGAHRGAVMDYSFVDDNVIGDVSLLKWPCVLVHQDVQLDGAGRKRNKWTHFFLLG
jgi:hypothetical protein